MNPRDVLRKATEGAQVPNYAKILSESGQEENVETLMEVLQYRPTGDLITDADDSWSAEDSLADIARYSK